MQDSPPSGVHHFPDFLSDFLSDFFNITEIDEAAQHWSLAAPEGRTWLAHRLRQEGHVVEESQILGWAFVAELTRAGIPDIQSEMAVGLVTHGITLRDLMAKPPKELTEQRWNCIADRLKDGIPLAQVIENETQDQELMEWLAKSVVYGNEHFVKRYFEQQFQRWKEAARALGDDSLSVEHFDILVVSDFHLAAGNHPSEDGLARFSPTEDFFFDDAFFRFLHHIERERSGRGGYPYELIFNGDSIDFAQLVVEESSRDELDPKWIPPVLRGAVAGRLWNDLMSSIADAYGDEAAESARLAHETLYVDILENRTIPESLDEERAWEVWWGDDWVRRYSYEPGTVLESISQEAPALESISWDSTAHESYQTWASEQEAGPTPSERTVMAMKRTKALGQLHAAYVGHRRFFQALAWFLAQGNRLVILRGNHDPQWYWPEVQLAFAGWLKAAYDELSVMCKGGAGGSELPVSCKDLELNMPDRSAEDFWDGLDFAHSWFYYRDKLAYIEHGNQQEVVDLQRYFLTPVVSCTSGQEDPLQDDRLKNADAPPRAEEWLPEFRVGVEEKEIDPPLGSLGLVYLVNNLEIEFPNFERPGYQKIYWRWMVSERPVLLLRLLGRGLFRVVKSWVRWVARLHPGVKASHEKRVKAYAGFSGIPLECVRQLDRTRWVSKVRSPLFEPFFRALLFLLLALPIVALVVGLVVGIRLLDNQVPFLQSGASFTSWLCSQWDWIPCPSPAAGQLIVDLLLELAKLFLFGFIPYRLARWFLNYIGLGEDYIFKPSVKIAQILQKHHRDVPYLLFGHDHAHNSQPLRLEQDNSDKGVLKRWYLNTGTWLHMHDKQRKRLLRTPHEYSLVRMMDTQRVLASRPGEHMLGRSHTRPRVELLRWNDEVNALEAAEIFKGKDEESTPA